MSTHLGTYVRLIHRSETTLVDSLETVGQGHAQHPDVLFTCQTLATMSGRHLDWLTSVIDRYGEGPDLDEPERLHAAGLGPARTGPVGLLRDLQDLHMLASLVQSSWTVIGQGAQGLRDTELETIAKRAVIDTQRQLAWFNTRMKVAAPQALVIVR